MVSAVGEAFNNVAIHAYRDVSPGAVELATRALDLIDGLERQLTVYNDESDVEALVAGLAILRNAEHGDTRGVDDAADTGRVRRFHHLAPGADAVHQARDRCSIGADLTHGAVWLARSLGLPYPAVLAPRLARL